jgi:hypothetical protein
VNGIVARDISSQNSFCCIKKILTLFHEILIIQDTCSLRVVFLSLTADEDPLPDIEGLCINGEAALGQKITACGVSVNGTTLCHFQV